MNKKADAAQDVSMPIITTLVETLGSDELEDAKVQLDNLVHMNIIYEEERAQALEELEKKKKETVEEVKDTMEEVKDDVAHDVQDYVEDEQDYVEDEQDYVEDEQDMMSTTVGYKKQAGTELWETPEGKWWLLSTVTMTPVGPVFDTRDAAIEYAVQNKRWTMSIGQELVKQQDFRDGLGTPADFIIKKGGVLPEFMKTNKFILDIPTEDLTSASSIQIWVSAMTSSLVTLMRTLDQENQAQLDEYEALHDAVVYLKSLYKDVVKSTSKAVQGTVIQSKIVKRDDGYYVISESAGKTLGGPYTNREEAETRMRQVEYFKYKGVKTDKNRFPDADRAGIEIKNASSLEHSGELLNHSTDESDFENRIIREIVFRLATGENKQKITSWLIDQKYEIPSYAEELYAKGLKEFKEQKKQYQEQQKVVSSKFDVIPGGVGQDLKPEDVDPKELSMGIKVEMEHTEGTDELSKEEKEAIAEDIAFDHLSEDPEYYTKLKKMEKSAVNEDTEDVELLQMYESDLAETLGELEEEPDKIKREQLKKELEYYKRQISELGRKIKTAGSTMLWDDENETWAQYILRLSNVAQDYFNKINLVPDQDDIIEYILDILEDASGIPQTGNDYAFVERVLSGKTSTPKKKKADTKLNEIKQSIIDGTDKYFGYAYFDISNMSDYGTLSDTIHDMVAVYGISEEEASELIMVLTHKHKRRSASPDSLQDWFLGELRFNDDTFTLTETGDRYRLVTVEGRNRLIIKNLSTGKETVVKYNTPVYNVIRGGPSATIVTGTQAVIDGVHALLASPYAKGAETNTAHKHNNKRKGTFGGDTGTDADFNAHDAAELEQLEWDYYVTKGKMLKETDPIKKQQLKVQVASYSDTIRRLKSQLRMSASTNLVQEDTVDSFTQLIAEALVSDMTEAQEYLASIFDAPWQKVKRQLTAELNGVYSDYIEKGLEQHQKALDELSVKREYIKKHANQVSDYLDTYPMFETTNKDAMRDFVLDAMDTFKMGEFELILALDAEYIYGNLDKEFVEAAQAVLDTMPVAASVKTSSLLYPYTWKSFASSDDPKEVAQYNEIANVLSLQVDKAVAVVEQFGLPVDRVNFDKIISNQLTPVDLLLIIECYNMSEENEPMFVLSYYSVPKGESDRTKWQAKVSNAVGFANLKEVITAAIHFAENVVKQGINKHADNAILIEEYNRLHDERHLLQRTKYELETRIAELNDLLVSDEVNTDEEKAQVLASLEPVELQHNDVVTKLFALTSTLNQLETEIDWAQVKGTKKRADEEEEFIDAEGHVLNEGDFVMLRDGARHGVIVSLNLYGNYVPQTELTPAEYPEQEVIIEWQDGSKGYYTPDELLVVRA